MLPSRQTRFSGLCSGAMTAREATGWIRSAGAALGLSYLADVLVVVLKDNGPAGLALVASRPVRGDANIRRLCLFARIIAREIGHVCLADAEAAGGSRHLCDPDPEWSPKHRRPASVGESDDGGHAVGAPPAFHKMCEDF